MERLDIFSDQNDDADFACKDRQAAAAHAE
jgi:hypothetical protein